ncbi:hypothetical protein DID76_01060 [Candidatus Marinamargulisbacteria bacterium SCGC AG-414-C22]|nr:hypothetical protein DID76_01060 [Candidatus Marinamargulisbacteria bacterium SCGC AG-414-C22]
MSVGNAGYSGGINPREVFTTGDFKKSSQKIESIVEDVKHIITAKSQLKGNRYIVDKSFENDLGIYFNSIQKEQENHKTFKKEDIVIYDKLYNFLKEIHSQLKEKDDHKKPKILCKAGMSYLKQIKEFNEKVVSVKTSLSDSLQSEGAVGVSSPSSTPSPEPSPQTSSSQPLLPSENRSDEDYSDDFNSTSSESSPSPPPLSPRLSRSPLPSPSASSSASASEEPSSSQAAVYGSKTEQLNMALALSLSEVGGNVAVDTINDNLMAQLLGLCEEDVVVANFSGALFFTLLIKGSLTKDLITYILTNSQQNVDNILGTIDTIDSEILNFDKIKLLEESVEPVKVDDIQHQDAIQDLLSNIRFMGGAGEGESAGAEDGKDLLVYIKTTLKNGEFPERPSDISVEHFNKLMEQALLEIHNEHQGIDVVGIIDIGRSSGMQLGAEFNQTFMNSIDDKKEFSRIQIRPDGYCLFRAFSVIAMDRYTSDPEVFNQNNDARRAAIANCLEMCEISGLKDFFPGLVTADLDYLEGEDKTRLENFSLSLSSAETDEAIRDLIVNFIHENPHYYHKYHNFANGIATVLTSSTRVCFYILDTQIKDSPFSCEHHIKKNSEDCTQITVSYNEVETRNVILSKDFSVIFGKLSDIKESEGFSNYVLYRRGCHFEIIDVSGN